MAGAGYKLFNTGDVLTAAQVNTYLQEQTVMVFADSSARTTALSGVLSEGMMSYLKSDDKVYKYDGSTWSEVGAAGGGMTLIQETVANANSSISFSGIPSTYKQLLLIWSGIKHSAAGSTFVLRENNSSSTTFNYRNIYASDSAGVTINTGAVAGGMGGNPFYVFGQNVASVISSYEYRANDGLVLIDNYASTSKYKEVKYNYGWRNDTSGAGVYIEGSGWLQTTSAISSLDIVRTSGSDTLSNLSNTSIRLYGVS